MDIIDSHVHLRNLDHLGALRENRAATGVSRMNIVCVFGHDTVSDNPPGLAAKALYPDEFTLFCGLDHANALSGGRLHAPSYAEQATHLWDLGVDGFKLIETKPNYRKMLGLSLTDPVFGGFFEFLEQGGMPLVWHVADPEEFWHPERTPKWAAAQGWGYDSTYESPDTLYSDVWTVLKRHPRLQVIFAHFFFWAGKLGEAERLFDSYPGVHFDLAPGIELLYTLSRDVDLAREFFIRHQDRIIFGTDIFGSNTTLEARERSGLVRRFLETDDEFRVGDDADFLLGPPEEGVIRGLALPEDVLRKILHGNFQRLTEESPRPLNRSAAAEECMRIAHEQAYFTDTPVREAPAAHAAEMIGQG